MMEYHNPKGVRWPWPCEKHEVCVIYVARYKDGIENYIRFTRSLAKQTGIEFGLFIVYKGFPDIETMALSRAQWLFPLGDTSMGKDFIQQTTTGNTKSKSMNLKETLEKCQEYGFNETITREILWNEAYRLGRSRWYWGPSWMVGLVGWFNTQRQRLGL